MTKLVGHRPPPAGPLLALLLTLIAGPQYCGLKQSTVLLLTLK